MILITPRLYLEPPDMSDAELFAEWLNDDEVVKYSEQRHRNHTAQSQRDYWHSSATSGQNFVLTIYQDLDAGNPIGSISAIIDPDNDIANVGIMIGNRSCWGKGYGFEAWNRVCDYLFTEKKIRKIEAGCMSLNAPMISIFTKYGMRHEAIIQAHFMVRGEAVGMHLYGKLAR